MSTTTPTETVAGHGGTPEDGHDEHHHDGPGFLAHHFDDPQQQDIAVNMGMWLFLATEVLFFGGLFAGYTVYRSAYPGAWIVGSSHLDVIIGTVNTAVLLVSSLTMALAVHAIQVDDRKACVRWLLATILLGSVFLGVKAVEYAEKWHHHLIPGVHYSNESAMEGTEGIIEQLKAEGKYDEMNHPERIPQQSQLFFSFYFAMTGLHALHMVIGIPLILWIAWQANRGDFSEHYFAPVENIGLYWHFVDIVWVFLFPMLYLIDRYLG